MSYQQLSMFPVATTHLYFYAESKNGLKVKVGITDRKLARRKRDLQTGSPEELILMGSYPDASYKIETALQSYFGDLLYRGEWFTSNSTQFKATALGGGLPPPIFEMWQEHKLAIADQWQLVEMDFPSVQSKVTAMLKDPAARASRRMEEDLIRRVIGDSQTDSFLFRQPFAVAIESIWSSRLDGSIPFKLEEADIAPLNGIIFPPDTDSAANFRHDA